MRKFEKYIEPFLKHYNERVQWMKKTDFGKGEFLQYWEKVGAEEFIKPDYTGFSIEDIPQNIKDDLERLTELYFVNLSPEHRWLLDGLAHQSWTWEEVYMWQRVEMYGRFADFLEIFFGLFTKVYKNKYPEIFKKFEDDILIKSASNLSEPQPFNDRVYPTPVEPYEILINLKKYN